MRAKLFTLRYSSTLGGFDADALDRFCAHHDVLSLRDHWFSLGEVPHVACIVLYQPLPVASTLSAEPARGSDRVGHDDGARPAWKSRHDELDLATQSRFAALRSWRNAYAREEGVPPYVVLTNQQLVTVAERNPDSAAALGAIEGIGPAKVRRHGPGLLAALGHAKSAIPQAAEPGGEA